MLKNLLLTYLIWKIAEKEIMCYAQGENVIKMYKFECENVNFDYFARNFSYHLKACNRHKSVVNMSGWLLQPLRNVTVHMQLFKYYSQFRPYFLNMTLDLCQAVAGNVVKNYYIKVLLRSVINTTNIVQECPISGYLYARDLMMDSQFVKLPIPYGRYLFFAAFYEGYPAKLLGQLSFYADIYRKNSRGNKINEN